MLTFALLGQRSVEQATHKLEVDRLSNEVDRAKRDAHQRYGVHPSASRSYPLPTV